MRQLVEHAVTDYAVFMVTALLGLIFLIIYLYFQQEKPSQLSIPGKSPSDQELGNLGDIQSAGSFHEFLLELHRVHGPIASFWWGKQIAVSLASSAAWKDVLPLFDRPVEQFALFKPLIGANSIQYANFAEGKRHRQLLDKSFGHSSMEEFIIIFNEVASELCDNWKHASATSEHIPLREHMLGLALKSIVRTSFGESFTQKEIIQFEKAYDACWSEMETLLKGATTSDSKEERQAKFDKALSYMHEKTLDVIQQRRKTGYVGKALLIDHMLEDRTVYPTDASIIDNVITNIIGGFHTTGNLLTWVIYYLCKNPHCIKPLRKEINDVIGSTDDVTLDHISEMTYMRAVIDETMRCSVLAPWAGRFSEFDTVVAGHTIPKKTPMILALGVVLQDKQIWPQPQRFDPSRFTDEKIKKQRPNLAFSPFGFAGKRKCPGYKFAYVEISAVMVHVLRHFDLELVNPEKEVLKNHGLVTEPREEIWITVQEKKV